MHHVLPCNPVKLCTEAWAMMVKYNTHANSHTTNPSISLQVEWFWSMGRWSTAVPRTPQETLAMFTPSTLWNPRTPAGARRTGESLQNQHHRSLDSVFCKLVMCLQWMNTTVITLVRRNGNVLSLDLNCYPFQSFNFSQSLPSSQVTAHRRAAFPPSLL